MYQIYVKLDFLLRHLAQPFSVRR